MADFSMPSLGADMKTGILVEWRVHPGDRVARGDIMAEVETDKGIFEVETFVAGTVRELLLQAGTARIPVGTVLAVIDTTEQQQAAPTEDAVPTAGARIRISPAARRLAAQHDLDLRQLSATGPQESISLADVERALAGWMAPAPQPLPPPLPVQQGAVKQARAPGAFKEGMRQAIAAAMSLSNREIPHYYLATDVDMSRALGWLEDYNRERPVTQRMLPVVLPLKAVALALRKVPELNGLWVDGALQQRQDIHIGFAVSLRGGGLMTPALQHVDRLSLAQLMTAVSDLISRTRNGQLRGSELTSAGLTVTSLGDLGVSTVFGVIYPPQVALVGLGRITERPWAENGVISARPVLTLTLAADHRAGDGHQGARFLDFMGRILQEPEKL